MSALDIFAGPNFPDAKCRGTYDQFFQNSEADLEAVSISLISICFSCVHRADCKDYAMENKENFGVWGGTTPAMRRREWRGGFPQKRVLNEERYHRVIELKKTGLNNEEISRDIGVNSGQVSRYVSRAKQSGLL